MKNIKMLISILVMIFLASAFSQEFTDARRLGLAGSNFAISQGTEFIGGNPATLAIPRSFNFELHLLSFHLQAGNNSYSLNEYDKYFTTGDSLTSGDIDDLMGKIPGDGLETTARFGVKTLSLYSRPFALNIYGMGAGRAVIPKDPLTLPFYGNRDKKEYRLDDLDGEGWAGAVVSLGYARILHGFMRDKFDLFAVGIAPKYVFGIQYAKVENATGRLITETEYVLADGRLNATTSEGGKGFGLDIGAIAQYNRKWTFSFSFTNLLGSIKWDNNNETHLVEFSTDTIRVNDLDSLETNDSDTSFAAGSFSTALPRVMILAAAYQFRPNWTLMASYQQGLNKSLGNETTPQLSVGSEYRLASVLPLRIGMAFGGEPGFALGLGMGIDLKYWQLNFGYLNHNFKWFRSAKTVELALTTQFRF
ncbi:MAG: hypothetical protein Kow0037_16640 [Calditrichia bacterium]